MSAGMGGALTMGLHDLGIIPPVAIVASLAAAAFVGQVQH